MGPNIANFPIFGKTSFQKKYPKIQNVNFWGEHQSCSHRNSAHFGTHTVSWGPLNDSFPDFHFFAKFAGIAISVCSGSPPRDRHLRLLRQPPPGIAISGHPNLVFVALAMTMTFG